MLKLDAICRNLTISKAVAALADPSTPPKRREALRQALAAARHKIRVDIALAEELVERLGSRVRAEAQPTILRMWRLLREAGARDIETLARTPEPQVTESALARAFQKAQAGSAGDHGARA